MYFGTNHNMNKTCTSQLTWPSTSLVAKCKTGNQIGSAVEAWSWMASCLIQLWFGEICSHSWQRTAESFSIGYTRESKFLCSSPGPAEGSPTNLEPNFAKINLICSFFALVGSIRAEGWKLTFDKWRGKTTQPHSWVTTVESISNQCNAVQSMTHPWCLNLT